MSDEPELDVETVATIDTVGATAYARGMGEAIATFYTALIDGGLPENLAEESVRAYLTSRFGTYDFDCDCDDEEDD